MVQQWFSFANTCKKIHLDCLLIAFISACRYSVDMELAMFNCLQYWHPFRTKILVAEATEELRGNQEVLEVTRLQTVGRRRFFAWPIDLWYLLPQEVLGVKEQPWSQGKKWTNTWKINLQRITKQTTATSSSGNFLF